jgi:hypothetical protein
MNGMAVMSQVIVMDGTIDISRLARGVYVLKCGARTARVVRQ